MSIPGRIACFLLSILISLHSYAQQEVRAYYNMGKSGSISFAAAPPVLHDLSGKGNDLQMSGSPLFFADAPADKKLEGEGSILFNGSASYGMKKMVAPAADKFILETWVKAGTLDNKDDHAVGKYAVVAYGDHQGGYMIAQQGSDWVAVVDGEKTYLMAPVSTEEWVHLALVMEEGNGRLYVNGKKTGSFKPATRINPAFSIGNAGDDANFHGLIYAVRFSVLTAGKFSAGEDLLLNRVVLEKRQRQATAAQKDLINAVANTKGITTVPILAPVAVKEDWLVKKIGTPVQLLLQKAEDGLTGRLLLTNGLIAREFYIAGNIACTSFKNLYNNAEFVRAIKPEARIMVDSVWYSIGGLAGQPEHAYLLESWYKDLVADPGAFRFSGIEVRQPEPRYPWQEKFNAVKADWPPKGLHVIMHYQAPLTDTANAWQIDVHYEMYEGAPFVRKWFTLENRSGKQIVVNKMECEVLAVNQDQKSRMLVESNYSFAAENSSTDGSGETLYPSDQPLTNTARFGGTTTHWEVDPEYNTWATQQPEVDVLYLKSYHRCLLLSTPLFGPAARVGAGEHFESFSTFEILHDADDQERQLLALRKMMRKLAPQVTESLLCGGITSNDPVQLKGFIDQLGELGFERLDIMAWPGISHDNLDPAYVSLWKGVADYAAKKNIIAGGYELQVASRGRGEEYDCIDPKTGKPGSFFGQSVCIASKWQDIYYPKMWTFFDRTGLRSLNVDGPYHGDPCASLVHPYHHDYYDSQWEQWKFQVSVVHELQRRNMYVPMPDAYFLNGSCATGMGYREASANLTPQQQLLLGRQYIYDGTLYKTPTMGWMTLQLVGFYSNDPRVGLEPLAKNRDRYEAGLFQLLASGCQFTIRGNRLYDTPETKAMVKKWVDWFKKYRPILTSDIIHIGRPTGRDLDVIFHVNPQLQTKGMLIVFNPTAAAIKRNFTIPLYYTGLDSVATIREKEGPSKTYTLNARQEAEVPLEVPAGGFTWLVID